MNVLSKIIDFQTDEMVYFQIRPSFLIKNGKDVEKLTKGLHGMYKDIFARCKVNNFKNYKISIQNKNLFYYAIVIEKKTVTFYLAVPQQWKNFVRARAESAWDNLVNVIEVEEDYLSKFNQDNCTTWELSQKEHYFKTLNADYRENAFLPSLFSTTKDMEQDDRTCFEMIMEPIGDTWKETAVVELRKYKKGSSIMYEKPRNAGEFVFMGVFKVIDVFFQAVDMIMGIDVNEKKSKRKFDKDNDLRDDSILTDKAKYDGFNGNIRLISESENSIRREQLLKGMNLAMLDFVGEHTNELTVYKKINYKKGHPATKLPVVKIFFKEQNLRERKVSKITKNIYNVKELANFMQLPSRTVQREYRQIDAMNVREFGLPEVLFDGGIPIGEIRYRGATQTVYFPQKDPSMRSMSKVIFGIQGSGKTEKLRKYAVKALELGESVFVLDGIKDCETSDVIRDYANIPEEKIIDLDFSKLKNPIPLTWSEAQVNKIKDDDEKFMFANHMSRQLVLFLDSMVDIDVHRLTPKMRRYLTSAGILVFSLPGTTIMDVFSCLTDTDARDKFIKQSSFSPNSKIVLDLKSLSDKSGSTRSNEIVGIIDRLDLLLGDFVLSALFSSKGSKRPLNFKRLADSGSLIVCRMPQDKLSDGTIDTLMTFLLSKIWLSHLMRSSEKNYKQTHVIVDEIHRYPTALKILNTVRESRKYSLCYFFSAHQPSDFKNMLNTVKSSGSHIFLMNTTKENLKHFEEELKPFEIEECLDTEKWHMKCLVNYDREYTTFDAKVPTILELDKSRKRIDKSHILKRSMELYGGKRVM